MNNNVFLKKLEDLAIHVNLEIIDNYLGRCTFGNTCYAVSIYDLNGVLIGINKVGLPEPKIDKLGLGYIVYWPDFSKM